MVHSFWQGTIAGTYVGHGETYQHPQDVLWWSKGGELRGQSPPRLAFLRRVLEDSPPSGINPIDKWWDVKAAGKAGEYYLIYFGREKPIEWQFELPKQELAEGMQFRVDVLDTWNMTVERDERPFKIIADTRYRYHAEGLPTVKLPGRPYMAVLVTRADAGQTFATEKRSEMAEEMTA
jgi:hypothetical protein